MLADPRLYVVAALQAGWGGTAAGISLEALTVMADRFDCRPEDLRIAIGPCIGPCHYEVDEPVMVRLRGWRLGEGVAARNARRPWELELPEGNRRERVDACGPAV